MTGRSLGGSGDRGNRRHWKQLSLVGEAERREQSSGWGDAMDGIKGSKGQRSVQSGGPETPGLEAESGGLMEDKAKMSGCQEKRREAKAGSRDFSLTGLWKRTRRRRESWNTGGVMEAKGERYQVSKAIGPASGPG